MKVIIAGSRDITDYRIIAQAIADAQFDITEVVSGGARGVDSLGMRWALQKHLPFKEFPADWNRYGISAGHVRNSEMADYADALVAVWDGESSGTASMIRIAKRKGLKIWVHNLKENK